MDWRERLARALLERHVEICTPPKAVRQAVLESELAAGPWLEYADAILACIDTAGCAILPEEPTEEMVDAGEEQFDDAATYDHRRELRGAYRAMYAARPK